MSDRFDEAQEALRKAGRPEEAVAMIERLAHNAVVECRFAAAGYYFLLLANEHVKRVQAPSPQRMYFHVSKNFTAQGLTKVDQRFVRKFRELSQRAELYYAYNFIYKYTVRLSCVLRAQTVD